MGIPVSRSRRQRGMTPQKRRLHKRDISDSSSNRSNGELYPNMHTMHTKSEIWKNFDDNTADDS